MAGNFYSGTDAEVLTGSANFSTLVSAAPTTYNLTAAQATAYATLNTSYSTAYNAAKEPSTRTSVTIATKDAAKSALVASAKSLAAIIRSSSSVTDSQLLALGLSRRSAPMPVPPPGDAPGLDVLSTSAWTVKIRLHDTASGSKRGKPPGVSGASVFSFVGATAPADLTSWQFEGNTGKTGVTVVFPNTLAAGTKIWLTAFWFNSRKQSGPTTSPVSANLPGGSVSLAAKFFSHRWGTDGHR